MDTLERRGVLVISGSGLRVTSKVAWKITPKGPKVVRYDLTLPMMSVVYFPSYLWLMMNLKLQDTLISGLEDVELDIGHGFPSPFFQGCSAAQCIVSKRSSEANQATSQGSPLRCC